MRRHGDTHTSTPGIHTPSRHTHTHTHSGHSRQQMLCAAVLCCAVLSVSVALSISVSLASSCAVLSRCCCAAGVAPNGFPIRLFVYTARGRRCDALRCGGNFQLLQRSTRQTRRDAMRHKLSSNCLHFLCTAPRSSQQPAASRTLSSPSPDLPFPLVFVVAIGLVRIDQVQAEWAFAKGGHGSLAALVAP